MGEGGQKIHISSYMINKLCGYNVQHVHYFQIYSVYLVIYNYS